VNVRNVHPQLQHRPSVALRTLWRLCLLVPEVGCPRSPAGLPSVRRSCSVSEDVCWLLCKRQGNRTLGKWITKRKRIWRLKCRNGRYCMTKMIKNIFKKQSVGGSGLDEFAENMGMEGLFLLIKPCAVLRSTIWWRPNFNFNYTSWKKRQSKTSLNDQIVQSEFFSSSSPDEWRPWCSGTPRPSILFY